MKRLSIACALFVALAGPAAAQEKFPAKPIKIIVPYGPGGGTDIVARIVAEEMRKSLGQPFLIENKPGANGLLGLEELMKSRPDGYTLILANQTVNVIAPLLYPKRLAFDVQKELRPVVRLADVPNVLLANKDFAIQTFPDLIAHAKNNPGKVRYGSTGVGSFPHFDLEILSRRAGIEMVHVPNAKGAAASLQDVLTGDVQIAFMNAATATAPSRGGLVRVLATADEKRHPDHPYTPTLAEFGLPGIGTVQWFSLLTRAGAPDDAVATLHAAAVAAVNSASVQEAFRKQGISAKLSASPEEAKAWVASEFAHWRKIFAEVPIQLEN